MTVAKYLRLSAEDADLRQSGKEESNSIVNQRNLLDAFIERTPDLSGSKVLEFCDDGWSGKNFERPAIKELLEQTRQGLIHCIIVKDMSRFGRDYLTVGNYISKVFPFLGVRLIAVNDGIDSIRSSGIDSLDTSFKALLYDLYSRDLSRKTRSARRSRAQKGEYFGARPLYGYVKDPERKNHLIIDSPAAEIVRRIFSMVGSGMSIAQTARVMNRQQAPTPTAKIICGDCSSFYGRKVWHSKSEYRSYIWRCNGKYDGECTCATPNLRETDIENAFVEAFHKLLGDKKQYIVRFEELLPLLADTSSLEKQLSDLENQHIVLKQNLQTYMDANTRLVQDQTEYNQRFSEMEAGCIAVEQKIDDVKKQILAQQGRKEQNRRCLDELRHCDSLLDEFSLDLWNSMVESVTVAVDGLMTFRFRDGTEIPVDILKK